MSHRHPSLWGGERLLPLTTASYVAEATAALAFSLVLPDLKVMYFYTEQNQLENYSYRRSEE